MAVAAYAAVVSLMHVLDPIPTMHMLHLDVDRIETLREKVSFLQDFLEVHSQRFYEDLDGLARQVALVTLEAEDIIDSHVVDQLMSQTSADKSDINLSFFWKLVADEGEDIINSHAVDQLHKEHADKSEVEFSFSWEGIDNVIEKLYSIKKELMIIKERMAIKGRGPRVSGPTRLSTPPSSGNNTMVRFDEHLDQIIDELTGDKCDLQVLPIIGMGGVGKTTLAGNAFNNSYIMGHFDIRTWLTVSQEYSTHRILLGLLEEPGDAKNKESGESLAKLGYSLHKRLFDRRYLIVLDDVWSTNIWNVISSFFPDNKNGSRIMVTTRLSNVAISLGSQKPHKMDFLDEDKSWILVCKKVFAKDGCCPSELEEIGKDIAKSCKGLPLAIVVIGGLLSTSNMTREYWEFVAKNVISFGNSGNDEHCLKILSLSYDHLSIHLKPCFLYMRVFPEGDEIQVSKLIKLWVAEGFLKRIRGKSLEVVAEGYLKDLIDRNLILIRKWKISGEIEKCGVHDFLRDLCLREFEKEQFLCVPKVQTTCFAKFKDRCFLCNGLWKCTRICLSQAIVGLQATSPASCSVCHSCRSMYPQLNAVRLARVIDAVDDAFADKFPSRGSSKKILHPTKLRYFFLVARANLKFISTSMLLLWNLQTILIRNISGVTIVLPPEIWEMPQLRHLIIDDTILSDPVVTGGDRTGSTVILENLQTLSTLLNFRCSEEVLKRIPNLTKLSIRYYKRGNTEWSYCSLHNLEHLHKLESLHLDGCWDCVTWKMVVFPHLLKRLILTNCKIRCEEMTMIGSLPNLEVLKLYGVDVGREWNPVEGEFLKLKLLLIESSYLECWGAEKDHFPNLESLFLGMIYNLKEIPSGIGEIETLRLINLFYCKKSVVNSAKEILKEQENLGIEGLQLHVRRTQKR